jgi:hypothetical protein
MAEEAGNKFGLLDDTEEAEAAGPSIADKLASFPVVKPRVGKVDLAAVDAAGAAHGFVSREVAAVEEPVSRRRRAIPAEPTRHLAIRLTNSAYNRFVAYADREKLTYHEALVLLLDTCGE